MAMGEVGGAAATQYAKFGAFTSMVAYSVQLTVTVAGVGATNTITISKLSAGVTTALTAATVLGTQVAGYTINVVLSAVAGGVTLLPGDVLVATTGADVTGRTAVTYEVSANNGTITA